MTDTNYMMFARPYSCRYCQHGYYGLGHVVDYAKQIGLWDIVDMQKEQAVKQPIYIAIDQHNPASYYGFGHGNDDRYTGDTEQDIFNSSECDKLAGRITYLFSCLTANGLGPAIIENGGKAFAGFNISWTWLAEMPPGAIGDPYGDKYAHGFYESANELWIALIDGYNVEGACQQSVDKYNEWIDYWFGPGSGISGAADAIKWLAYDRDGLVALGDLSARLFECDKYLNKEDCLANDCFWYNGICTHILPSDIQDSRHILIKVPEAYADLLVDTVEYPAEAYEGDQIEILYNIKNTGGHNLIYGQINDLDTHEILNYWERLTPHDETFEVITTLPPMAKDWNIQIEVGHKTLYGADLCTWLAAHGAPSNLTVEDIFVIIDSYLFQESPTGYNFIPTLNNVFGVIDYYLNINGDPLTGCDFFP